jgi:hypothetical protein
MFEAIILSRAGFPATDIGVSATPRLSNCRAQAWCGNSGCPEAGFIAPNRC